MKKDKWEKIIDVFNSALEVETNERNEFVNQQFKDDPVSVNEVLELLNSHEEAEDFIEEPPVNLSSEALAKNNDSNLGKQIGAYKIEKQIGTGGMGTVFLASRADKQFEQKVAIKLLKRGMDTNQIIQRFKYERQILAELNHPYIAKLLDGGTTDDGLPYFVLEYIEGLPITEYCQTNKLNLLERLSLFRQVCDAISYAHQNLVVHRDIKPSNIIVTEEGTPKLLDFGIAKVLDTDIERTNLTVAGERLMTPKYASPEQVRGKQITTSSDVYSLGVLLFELLTGNLPYKLESNSQNEIEKIICEQEPSLPSSGFNNETLETKENLETVDSEFQKANSKLLKGDLDNITLMALEKQPNARYESVNEFSTDIKRYLKGLPVIARKHTYFYRVSKFVRRHSIGVAVAGLFAVLLIGFAVNTQIQANRIASERDRSEKALSFMRDIFKGSDPANTEGKEISARELLDTGVIKIENELNEQPDVQAELMDTVGQVYQSLGLYEKAESLFKKALEKRRDFFGNESFEVAQTLLHLGDVQRIKANFAEAEKNTQESLEIRRNLFGKNSDEYIDILGLLVQINFDKKDLAKAEEFAVERISLSKNIHGNESKQTIAGLINLADVQMNRSETEKAEKSAREAVELSKKVFDKPSEEAFDSNIMLARLLFFKKREFVESKELLDEAEKIGEEVYGKIHPRIVWILTNKAFHNVEQEKYKEAINISNKILEIQRQLYGDEHALIASILNEKGGYYFQAEEYENAENMWNQALKMRQKLLGAEHPRVTGILSNLALVKYEQGDYSASADAFRKSLAIQKKVMKETDPQIGFSLVGLGKSLVADGKAQQAESMIREGVGILEKSFFKNTWYFADAQNVLGVCLLAQNKHKEAEPLLTSSYEKIKEKHGENHKKTNQAREYLAKLYKSLGQKDKAEKYAVKS